nr:hypothetical protein [Streptomyces sp. 44030]
MSWPQAVAASAAIIVGLAFNFLLIFMVGVDPVIATGLTILLVAGIVAAIIPPRRGGLMRRFGAAVQAFFSPGGAQ